MMRELFDLSVLAAGLSILGFILISIFGSILEKSIKDETENKKMGRLFIKISFLLFLVLCFSVIPVVVGVFIPALQAVVPVDISIIAKNDMLIVFGFWVIYIIGIIIMLPVMKKEGFFEPEKFQVGVPMSTGQPLEKLKSKDALERLRAVGSLRDTSERGEDISYATATLVEILSDKDEDVRASAARLLTDFYAQRKQWNEIDRILTNKAANVRSSAIYSLGRFAGSFDTSSEIPNLLKSLDDSDYEVRGAVAGFFETAAAKGLDISHAIPGLKKIAINGDALVKESVSNAIKSSELKKKPGQRCYDCLDCETGLKPGNESKCFEDIAIIIKTISCCQGDVTSRVFRCSKCGKHYLSTYFNHSDYDHEQFSISIISEQGAESIANMISKCPKPEWRLCKCTVHTEYLKDETVPVEGELKYSMEDTG